jgi:hypothetical protein
VALNSERSADKTAHSSGVKTLNSNTAAPARY